MNKTQDPQRKSFRYKNVFKILFPKNKNARLFPNPLSLLNIFETNLTESIRELIPKDKNDILTVSWMNQAMESLCETHKSFRTLVTDLKLSVSDLDENFIRMYSHISFKLLELCNAFTSELERLNHGNLLLKFALTKLETNNCLDGSSVSHLDYWNIHMVSKNPRIENCGAVLTSLVESMYHYQHHLTKKAKKKQSTKGKVLLRALYDIKIKTLYIFGVFAAAFSGSSKNLSYLTVPKELPWVQAFMELQNTINPEIKSTLLSDGVRVIKDLETVESDVKKIYRVVQEGSVVSKVLVEPLKRSVIELSERFDLVSKETRCLSKIVISGRDALLERLWMKYADELGATLPMMMNKTFFANSRNMNILSHNIINEK